MGVYVKNIQFNGFRANSGLWNKPRAISQGLSLRKLMSNRFYEMILVFEHKICSH